MMIEETLCAFAARCREKIRGRRIFDHLACVHKHDPIRDAAGEFHFVGYDDTCHPGLLEVRDDVEHFSHGLRVERRRWLDRNMKVVSDDVGEQARKVFENMAEVLAAAGACFADVLKVTVFLKDVNDRVEVNLVRKEFFGVHRPASTLIGIAEFTIPGMKLEIEAVVGLPNQAAA
jgi:2-iminobutanoate/2-iminopropanoate deaminase